MAPAMVGFSIVLGRLAVCLQGYVGAGAHACSTHIAVLASSTARIAVLDCVGTIRGAWNCDGMDVSSRR